MARRYAPIDLPSRPPHVDEWLAYLDQNGFPQRGTEDKYEQMGYKRETVFELWPDGTVRRRGQRAY